MNESLVKTIRFKKVSYVGDPANTLRIFNELEIDEILILDIRASIERRSPNYKLLADLGSECFMPLAYGGGIKTLDEAKKVFDVGVEKVSINSSLVHNPEIITKIANQYGSQAVIASIDVKAGLFGNLTVRTLGGRQSTSHKPVKWAKTLEEAGAGEILLTSIDREGTWAGFDTDLVNQVSNAVSIPVIAHGGAGSIEHIIDVVKNANASAVALGSMVVFQKKGMGVLVNFPETGDLYRRLS